MSQQKHPPLTAWLGRQQTLEDEITLWPAQALAATLGLPTTLAKGSALPPLWHWLYFLPLAPAATIGPDGHPETGNFLPPVALPRRMWAGGRLAFHRDLHIGDCLRRVSTVSDITEKEGASGRLVFVTVTHDIYSGTELLLAEQQDLVYRAAANGVNSAAPQGRIAERQGQPATWHTSINPDPVLLFRYAALTFNGHRIHYDQDYAQQQEGYPERVVQGPLIATLLLNLAQQRAPHMPVQSFSFRARAPLFALRPFTLHARAHPDNIELWAADQHGREAMTAELNPVGRNLFRQ